VQLHPQGNSHGRAGESLALCSSGAEASTELHGFSAAALYNRAVLVRGFSKGQSGGIMQWC